MKMQQTGCECSESKQQVRYRWRLTVQSPGGTPDAGGHVDYTLDENWNLEGRIKGNFISKGGREFIQGNKLNADVTHLIETPSNRFSRRIQPAWRLKYDGRTFEILAAYDKDEARDTVQIQAKEAK